MKDAISISPAAPARASAAAGVVRSPTGAGGAALAPRFALLMTFLAVDVAAFVGPHYAFRAGDGPFAGPDRAAFLAFAAAGALAFGFAAAVLAESRGRSAWFFLLGHLGFPAAFVAALAGADLPGRFVALGSLKTSGAVAAALGSLAIGAAGLYATRRFVGSAPRAASFAPPDRALRALGRATAALGGLRPGIVLMAAIAIVVAAGTIVEDRYGPQAAQSLVYRSPWFGALFFTGGLSMLCATFRKYPYRLEQAGWLVVHAGLAGVVGGAMASFLASVEGELTIREGATGDAVVLAGRSRLSLDETSPSGGGLVPVLRAAADFEADPLTVEPERAYASAPGATPVRVVVEKYFPTAEPVRRRFDDGPAPRFGLEAEVRIAGGAPSALALDESEEDQASIPFGARGIPVTFLRPPAGLWRALANPTAPADHGAIVVTDDGGRELLSLPVEPPVAARAEGVPATLARVAAIPETDVEVRLLEYYDHLRPDGGRGFRDATPGNPVNPAVKLVLRGSGGEDVHHAFAYFPEKRPADGTIADGRKLPYRVEYRANPRVVVEGPELVFAAVDGVFRWLYVGAEGARTAGEVALGVDLPLPAPMLKVRVTATQSRLRLVDDYELRSRRPERQVARVRLEGLRENAPAPAAVWLPLGARKAIDYDGRTYLASWSPERRPLGFSLRLEDFHREFYPGSSEETAFESYCRLVHPTKFPAGADVKIDMNHPLRLDGWRLFQSRFGGDGRTTILQANRDPGLGVVYPACAVVALGLVVVFFMKDALRRRRYALEAAGAPRSAHLRAALGAIAAVGAGPLLFAAAAAGQGVLWPAFTGAPAVLGGALLALGGPYLAVRRYVDGARRESAVPHAAAPAAGATA